MTKEAVELDGAKQGGLQRRGNWRLPGTRVPGPRVMKVENSLNATDARRFRTRVPASPSGGRISCNLPWLEEVKAMGRSVPRGEDNGNVKLGDAPSFCTELGGAVLRGQYYDHTGNERLLLGGRGALQPLNWSAFVAKDGACMSNYLLQYR